MTAMSRHRRSTLLAVLAGVFLLGATIMVFAQDRLFDADDFAVTLSSTLEDPAVNEYLADEVSAALIAEVPDLAVSGPLLADVTGSVLQSDTAKGIVEFAAVEAHQVAFEGGEGTLLLELSDLAVAVQGALQGISPELADAIPEEVETLTVALSTGDLTADTVRLAERLRFATVVLVVIAVALIAALLFTESALFAGLARVGAMFGVVGFGVVVIVAVGAAIAASYGLTPLQSEAIVGIWSVVLGDLARWGWTLAVTGAVLAGLGWAVDTADDVATRARDLLSRVITPTSRRASIVRTVALWAVALWAIFEPASLVTTGVRGLGLALGVFLLAELVDRLGLRDRLRRAQERVDRTGGPLSPGQIGTRFGWSALVVVVLGVAATLLLASDDDASALGDPDACNGHVELCDRRLDEVTMAAAHNSMSSTATDFYLPNHLIPMRSMLDLGVRGFMIDTVYGRTAEDGTVRTSLGLGEVESLDEEARRAAEAVQARQTGDLGEEMVFLCHGFCEIGSLDAVAELEVLAEWLDANPREVVVVIVQDETSPPDTAQMFVDAGLESSIATLVLDQPLPTLGEMIESERRVVVMVENDGSGIDWLHDAFAFSQETPFSFASAEEFSCEANRGDPDAPLFVVNHFITLARASNQTINDLDVLLDRVEDCAAARGLHPNLLSLDFVGQGDVMEVVDRLNGVD